MNTIISEKYCSKCHVKLTIENWYNVYRTNKRNICKTCTSIIKKLRRTKTGELEKERERHRKWALKNRDKRIEYDKKYREKNKDQIKIQNTKWRYKKIYGIAYEEVLNMIANQENTCAICKEVFGENGFCVDHDHVSGKVRGILCDLCNRGLGHFKDKVNLLENAILYLKRMEN